LNAVLTAAEGKGLGRMIRRGNDIGSRYGLTTGKMDEAVNRFARVLRACDCGATFPLTAVALARNRWDIESFRSLDIEFAVHGLCHIDHSRIGLAQQLDQLGRAMRLFAERGINRPGFRGPYLRCNADTLTAVRQLGFAYDCSQGLAWPVVDGLETEAYRHVLQFYRALPATDYPALPRLEDGLVRMPYSLPDDEAFVDRLALTPPSMERLWTAILAETYRLGELFVLGLHPERIRACEAALVRTLRAARELSPGVWVARLDEIARWWAERSQATVACEEAENGALRIRVSGPAGLTVLARRVRTSAPAAWWSGVYRQVGAPEFDVFASQRPFIAVSERTSPRLTSFLCQQGYIVEAASRDHDHALTLDEPEFAPRDERPLLALIEGGAFPLVRFSRWPDGRRSALAITGDIDALTLWDYGLRLFGR
jgi:peptidoglycan/xylan/chitin deacetylase (PgdA/CDA1 family)